MKTIAIASTLLMTAVTVVSAAENLVPLKLELPKPRFIGTPTKVKLPHLEKPLGKARPDFMVPAGTTNISNNKTVTSSDDFPIIGELEMVTDGDKEGVDGSFVELGPLKQWVQIDLEKESTVACMVLWHYHTKPRAYIDVVVQFSNDPKFEKGVTTAYNSDHDNSSGFGKGTDGAYIETNEGRLIDTKGQSGRYVRLYSRGNTENEMNHYVEVEVYGKAK